MAFKMKGSPMSRNFKLGDPEKRAVRKEKRAQKRRNRLEKKGKLVASESLTPSQWKDYAVSSPGGGQGGYVTDPKKVVVDPTSKEGTGRQYKVSKKGKIKKEV